jgi:hypothetical protein
MMKTLVATPTTVMPVPYLMSAALEAGSAARPVHPFIHSFGPKHSEINKQKEEDQ